MSQPGKVIMQGKDFPVPRKKKILIVEDDLIIALVESKLFERNGYSIQTAASGEESVEYIRFNDDIDLVLMDINLGSGISGFEAAVKIFEIKDILLIFLSSENFGEIMDQVRSIPCFGYVNKNMDMSFLLSLAAKALEYSDLRKCGI